MSGYAAQNTWYRAACPGCGNDVTWRTEANSTGDLARTVLTIKIECVKCGNDHQGNVSMVARAGLV
jgi:predicted nucleic-acid-binding Zn-ribbon protein